MIHSKLPPKSGTQIVQKRLHFRPFEDNVILWNLGVRKNIGMTSAEESLKVKHRLHPPAPIHQLH